MLNKCKVFAPKESLQRYLIEELKEAGFNHFTPRRVFSPDYSWIYLEREPQPAMKVGIPEFGTAGNTSPLATGSDFPEVTLDEFLKEIKKTKIDVTFKDNDAQVTVHVNGDVTYGCTTVKKEVVDKIFEIRAKFNK